MKKQLTLLVQFQGQESWAEAGHWHILENAYFDLGANLEEIKKEMLSRMSPNTESVLLDYQFLELPRKVATDEQKYAAKVAHAQRQVGKKASELQEAKDKLAELTCLDYVPTFGDDF